MKKLITTYLSTLLCTSAFSFSETYVVEAYTMTFVPDVVNVQPGDVIRWEYVTGYPHDVTSGTKCMDDGYLFLDIPSGGSVEWTVPNDAPSEIPYFCTLHCGSGMTGMINVEGDSDEGRMVIGIVDSSNCNFLYEDYGDGMESMSFHYQEYDIDNNTGANFLLGVEVEDADVEVWISMGLLGTAELNVFDASAGTTSPVVAGQMTLSAGQKYAFTGSSGSTFTKSYFFFEIEWPEGDDEGGMDMIIHGEGGNSVSASGDDVMFRASEYGVISMEISVEQDEVMQMTAVANVSCATLIIPTNGEEGEIEIPIGTHFIFIGGGTISTPAEMGVLLMQMGDGDDDGGLPEDVNGDGVVNVNDLLAIIGAWGATSP